MAQTNQQPQPDASTALLESLRDMRIDSGYTQAELADHARRVDPAIRLTAQHVAHIEHGRREPPLRTVVAMARALGRELRLSLRIP